MANESLLLEQFQHMPNRRKATALIILSPGWEQPHYDFLMKQLWLSEFNVWTLDFPIPSQELEKMEQKITKAIEALPENTVVFGHGLGGTLATQTIRKRNLSPKGLVLLASPLHFRCTKALQAAFAADPSSELDWGLLF